MKTNKYKAKRLDNNEWVYGFYYEKEIKNKFYTIVYHFIYDLKKHHEVDGKTAGQYIGLITVLLAEIYEDDIIRVDYRKNGGKLEKIKVEYKDGCYRLPCSSIINKFTIATLDINVISNMHDDDGIMLGQFNHGNI